MSDSNNRPPDDEWIKSLYSSGKDNEDLIPESLDAEILAKARQPQQIAGANRFQSYPWMYGTAASALLGVLLILQIPEPDTLPSLLENVEERRVQASKFVAISKKEAPGKAESDVNVIVPMAQSIDEVVVYAQRAFSKSPVNPSDRARETRTDELEKTPSGKDQDFLELPTPNARFSTLMERELSHCIKLNAYLTNTVEKQLIEQCETDTQLSFRFEQESTDACKEIFQFALESSATVSIRNRDSESGVEEIQIEHAGKLYTLRCDAGQWVLTPGKQP